LCVSVFETIGLRAEAARAAIFTDLLQRAGVSLEVSRGAAIETEVRDHRDVLNEIGGGTPTALRRDFKPHADGLAAEKAFGEAGLRVCDQLFWAWEIFQHTGDRRDLKLAVGRCAASSSRSCAPTPPRRRATSTRAGWHATC
jgi:hypothetical protein